MQSDRMDQLITTWTATDLEPSHQYVFHVIARDIDGRRNVLVSNSKTFYTMPDPTTASQTESTINSVTLNVNDDLTTMGQDVSFRLYYAKAADVIDKLSEYKNGGID